MDAYKLLDELIARIEQSGLTVAEVCRKAGIQHSLISKWKAKTYEPRLSSLSRMEAARAELASPSSVRDLL